MYTQPDGASVTKNSVVHGGGTREPTAAVTARIPVAMLRLLQAIGAKRGHYSRNDTLVEAFEEYIDRHMSEIAPPKVERSDAGALDPAA